MPIGSIRANYSSIRPIIIWHSSQFPSYLAFFSIPIIIWHSILYYWPMRSSRYWLGGRFIRGRSTVTSFRLTASLTSTSLPLTKDELRPDELSWNKGSSYCELRLLNKGRSNCELRLFITSRTGLTNIELRLGIGSLPVMAWRYSLPGVLESLLDESRSR